MTRWERLEEYLFDHDKDGTDFDVREYVTEAGLEDVSEGSKDIQSYLKAQRLNPQSSKVSTLYVLRRVPTTRTSSSRWAVGTRSRDARLIGRGLADDTKRRVERAFMPDLLRLRKLNPRAARTVEAQITSVVDNAMALLAVAAEGMRSDDDE